MNLYNIWVSLFFFPFSWYSNSHKYSQYTHIYYVNKNFFFCMWLITINRLTALIFFLQKCIDLLQKGLINPQSHVEHFVWWIYALLLDFKILNSFTVIIKLGRARNLLLFFFFLYHSDCIRLKEESHIHLGLLEGEQILGYFFGGVNYPLKCQIYIMQIKSEQTPLPLTSNL